MPPIRVICLSVFLICLAANCDAELAPKRDSKVELITIEPAWSGPGQRSEMTVTIKNVHGVFRRSWRPVDSAPGLVITAEVADLSVDAPARTPEVHPVVEDEVSRSAVDALVQALREPVLPTPELENLGITREWLASYANAESKSAGTIGEANDERQQAFFGRSLQDWALVQKLLPGIVRSSWTDDPVWVQVRIVFSDGATWVAKTDKQPPFMLPWTCTSRGQRKRTYNANISRAVAALLPKDSLNQERLSGVGMEGMIRTAVAGKIKGEWQQMGAEDRAGAALAQLRQRYLIRRSEVSGDLGLTYGAEWKDGVPREMNLQADMRMVSFPKNLVIAAVFPIHDGKVEGVDAFLTAGSKYEGIILTNPWLMRSLREHPDVGAWLEFSKEVSFSDKAMRIFSADMRAIGRDDLVQQVVGRREDVALMNYYGNQLVLFPDHHAIVWRWGTYRELFKWPASSLKPERCTDYNTATEGCVGAVIGPDGGLVN